MYFFFSCFFLLPVRQRFGVVISEYLRCCGIAHRIVLGHAVWFMGKLKHITRSLQKAHKKKSKDKLLYLKSQLTELNKILPKNGIRLPLITCASNVSHGTSNNNASVRGSGSGGGGGGSGDGDGSNNRTSNASVGATTSRVTRFIIDKCKIMNSKKTPLWLVFATATGGGDGTSGSNKQNDGNSSNNISSSLTSVEAPETVVTVLFKDGDDLRQDQLTIAVMRVVERCWSRAGLDLKMLPYGCVSKFFSLSFGLFYVSLGGRCIIKRVVLSLSLSSILNT